MPRASTGRSSLSPRRHAGPMAGPSSSSSSLELEDHGMRVSLSAGESHGRGRKSVKIIVVADILCMWSYIALREINVTIKKVAQKMKKDGVVIPHFDVEFRPFFLYPEELSEEELLDRDPFFEQRLGKTRWTQSKDLVTKRGTELGLSFQFRGKVRQTTRAHRLIYLAYQRGGSALQQKVLEEIYQAFWVRGLDIGSIPLLASIASRIGFMPYETATMWLESSAGEGEVKKLAAISNECGIGGCPFTVIEGKWAIIGGEYTEVLGETMEKVIRGDLS